MSKSAALPPDQAERERALNPANSILVQAPAGSGKTDLLTRRFLCLLAQVEDPGQIVAITFTKAAAAEMRHRILSKLEDAAAQPHPASAPGVTADPFSMQSLAHRALHHAQTIGWNLLDQPAQLRISTIDSFCRDLALQQPLLSGLGDALGIYGQPKELYRRAARQALEQIDAQIDGHDPALRQAIEGLLLWRDNNWQEMENLLVEMLSKRDRWMHGFVLEREQDWEALRERLERPFANALHESLVTIDHLLDQVPGSRDEALTLARFACEEAGEKSPWDLAECPEIPCFSFNEPEDAVNVFAALAAFLQTQRGTWRSEKGLKTSDGFPSTLRGKAGKARFATLISKLSSVPDLESALAAVRTLPPARYTEEDWQIVRACFTLLRHAAGQLKVVFAEAGAVDYIEVAQIALNVLYDADGLPSDAAISVADGIRHILVDEFQDTSRRQHELLRRLIAAWPQREGRSCFVVGDPMQSIYFFRDADAELFPRVKAAGLEIPNADPLLFHPVALTSNFRTAKSLVARLNEIFNAVFAENDGSGVTFSPASPARNESTFAISLLPEGAVENSPGQAQHSPGNASRLRTPSPVGAQEAPPGSASNFELHINFTPQIPLNNAVVSTVSNNSNSYSVQIDEIVALIRNHMSRIEQARAANEKYRIAVLGRTRAALAPIAQALREAEIPFRAVDLELLSSRPEILDALALARALLNPLDRVSWLGVLRAPWCGLSLHDLHILASADDPELLTRPIPELLAERLHLLSADGRLAAQRVLDAVAVVPALRFAQPTASLGTWLKQVWLSLGGAQCVDPAARVNLDLFSQSLDNLPNGELDLLGPALSAALDDLKALPDPKADSNCGVQLMTIHKSKGLEFEVVIVPELQAGARGSSPRLLSWLERGLPPEEISHQSEDSNQVTEFLVAPLQAKGSDRGATRQWVDRVYRQREVQEARRILYVAATRARDELHLFVRPACKQDKTGAWTLAEPSESLLATAWPALEPEIRQRFDAWKSAIAEPESQLSTAPSSTIDSLAASADSNLLVMPAPLKPTLLRRLPPSYRPARSATESPLQPKRPGAPSALTDPPIEPGIAGTPSFCHPERAQRVEGPAVSSSGEKVGDRESPGAPGPAFGTWEPQLYTRHEGGLLSRALGVAVHSLLENLARLRKSNEWETARAALQQLQPRAAAQIRAIGIEPVKAAAIAADALRLALDASIDPTGQWILSPHPEDFAEVRWTGIVAGTLRTVQVDRVFRAGLNPSSPGDDTWWIIDYKTAHADGPNPSVALPQMREIFAPQVNAYAELLRKLHGADAQIRAGLYYPRMFLFDWWELG